MKDAITVYLCDLVHDYFKTNWAPGFSNYTVPLNIGYVGAYLKEILSDIDLHLFKYPKRLERALEVSRPDVIAFSYYTWNQELVLHFAKRVKEMSPQTLVVIGGPNVNFTPSILEQFLKTHPFIDHCVIGEGEIPFTLLVKAFIETRDINELKREPIFGTASYDGEFIYPIERNQKMESELIYPSPYLMGLLDEFIQDEHLYPMFETTRGCPYSCTYCAWGLLTKKHIKQWPLEKIFAEFEYVIENGRPYKLWQFADSNFGILPRDVAIAERLRDLQSRSKIKQVYFSSSKNTAARNIKIAEILGDMATSLVAFQTLDKQVLKNIKRSNMEEETFIELINYLKGKDIPVTTQLIRGLPGETYDSSLDTLRKCLDYDIRHIQMYPIQVLNATELATEESRMRYGLKTKFYAMANSYGKYFGRWVLEVQETIDSSDSMSQEDILKLRLIYFFIWLGWCLGVLRPIYLAAKACNINPLDQIVSLIENPTAVSNNFSVFIENFRKEAKAELFDSKQDLINYYCRHENPETILDNGAKLHLRGAVNILSNKVMLNDVLDYLVGFIKLKEPFVSKKYELDSIKEFTLNHLCLDLNNLNEEITMPLTTKMYEFLTKEKLIVDISNTLDATRSPAKQYSLRFCLDQNNKETLKFYVEKYMASVEPTKIVVTTQSFIKQFFRTITLFEDGSASGRLVSFKELNYV